jgi:hypothetical protein
VITHLGYVHAEGDRGSPPLQGGLCTWAARILYQSMRTRPLHQLPSSEAAHQLRNFSDEREKSGLALYKTEAQKLSKKG